MWITFKAVKALSIRPDNQIPYTLYFDKKILATKIYKTENLDTKYPRVFLESGLMDFQLALFTCTFYYRNQILTLSKYGSADSLPEENPTLEFTLISPHKFYHDEYGLLYNDYNIPIFQVTYKISPFRFKGYPLISTFKGLSNYNWSFRSTNRDIRLEIAETAQFSMRTYV